MEFLTSINWWYVLVAVAAAATLYGTYQWKSFGEAAQALFLMAEKAMAQAIISSGPEAMQKVAQAMYDMMPTDVRLAIKAAAAIFGTTPEELTKWLCQYVYDQIKAKYGRQQVRWQMVAKLPESEGMM